MKNYKMKTAFISAKGVKVRSNKTGIDFMIFILIFVENCLENAKHNLLKTDSDPAEKNRLRSHTGKRFLVLVKVTLT